MYGRDAIYHLLVQDDSGSLRANFFHGGYLEDRPEAWPAVDPARQVESTSCVRRGARW